MPSFKKKTTNIPCKIDTIMSNEYIVGNENKYNKEIL